MEGVRLKVAGKRKIVGVVGVDGDVWELMGGEEEGGGGGRGVGNNLCLSSNAIDS